MIDAYATFYILSFTKILCVSVDLLIPVRVHSLNNGSVRWVLYYDATLDYFGREHLPYAILAIACTAVFTAPIIFLLLFYQLRCIQRLLTCLKIHSQLLHAVMDSFQGCYKNGMEPGTRDCRWFAAVHLIGRLVLLLIYSVTQDEGVFSNFIIATLSIIVIMTIVQPYKTHLLKFAKLDITFWAFLATFYAVNASRNHNIVETAGAIYNCRSCPPPLHDWHLCLLDIVENEKNKTFDSSNTSQTKGLLEHSRNPTRQTSEP